MLCSSTLVLDQYPHQDRAKTSTFLRPEILIVRAFSALTSLAEVLNTSYQMTQRALSADACQAGPSPLFPDLDANIQKCRLKSHSHANAETRVSTHVHARGIGARSLLIPSLARVRTASRQEARETIPEQQLKGRTLKPAEKMLLS
jgi:hypothetical protein